MRLCKARGGLKTSRCRWRKLALNGRILVVFPAHRGRDRRAGSIIGRTPRCVKTYVSGAVTCRTPPAPNKAAPLHRPNSRASRAAPRPNSSKAAASRSFAIGRLSDRPRASQALALFISRHSQSRCQIRFPPSSTLARQPRRPLRGRESIPPMKFARWGRMLPICA